MEVRSKSKNANKAQKITESVEIGKKQSGKSKVKVILFFKFNFNKLSSLKKWVH